MKADVGVVEACQQQQQRAAARVSTTAMDLTPIVLYDNTTVEWVGLRLRSKPFRLAGSGLRN